MQRKNFIQIALLGLAGITSSSFWNVQQEFSEHDLMGKGEPKLYGNGYQLRKSAHEAFLKMKAAAIKSGIDIKVVSSYRSYGHQNRIWERKYRKFITQGLSPMEAIYKIIEYSTIPGTSRHHWGTDIDIVDANPPQPKGLLLEKNFHNDGPFCKLKQWMDIHASDFGYKLVYTDRKDRKGFKYEPWHYSYAPLSIPMLKAYKKLNIPGSLQKNELLGSDKITTDFIEKYIKENILDINPELL